MVDYNNPSPELIKRARKLSRVVTFFFVAEFLVLIFSMLVLPIKEKPHLLAIMLFLTGIPMLVAIVLIGKKIWVCPSCHRQAKNANSSRCEFCGSTFSRYAVEVPVHFDVKKEFLEKSKCWVAPSELLVPKPRNIRMGSLSKSASFLRAIIFMLICSAVFLIIQNDLELSPVIFCFLGLAALFCVFNFKNTKRQKKIIDYGEPVPGIVNEIQHFKGSASAKIYYQHQGVERISQLRFFGPAYHPVGELVTVLIDPDNPNNSLIYPGGL